VKEKKREGLPLLPLGDAFKLMLFCLALLALPHSYVAAMSVPPLGPSHSDIHLDSLAGLVSLAWSQTCFIMTEPPA